MKTDFFFNGTGINYSWHLPRLFDSSLEDWKKQKSLTFISGASTAFLVYWVVKHRLVTWNMDDFLNWNRHSARAYGNNLISGAYRFLKLSMKSKTPVYSQTDYRRAWAIAVKPEFFEIKFKELPSNIRFPLLNRSTNEIIEATPDSEFGELPAYLISFAGTAIPSIFPDIKLGDTVYGDATYSRRFLHWLKAAEKNSEQFENYNLFKEATFANGRYIKVCDHPEPRKMMKADNIRFLFGRHIESYPENIRKTKLILE